MPNDFPGFEIDQLLRDVGAVVSHAFQCAIHVQQTQGLIQRHGPVLYRCLDESNDLGPESIDGVIEIEDSLGQPGVPVAKRQIGIANHADDAVGHDFERT